MTTPAYNKTWQHAWNLRRNTNEYYGLYGASDGHIAVYLELISTLTGWTSSPWIGESSSDAATAVNNDPLNFLIVDSSDFTFSTTAHTWFVLKQPGLLSGGNASVLFDFKSTSFWAPHISFSASGFGGVNGGMDGTIAAAPTAAAGMEIILNPSGVTWQNNANGNIGNWWNYSQSTDGQVTRIWQMEPNANQCVTFMQFERAKNPIAIWDTPIVVRHYVANPAMSLTNTWQFFTANGSDFIHGGIQGKLGFFHALPHNWTTKGGNDIRPGTSLMLPILLYSATAGLAGLWGTLFDLYITPFERQGLTANDENGQVKWVTLDSLWIPAAEGMIGSRG